MTDHDFVLKVFSLYPVHGMTNEVHKNTSVRLTALWDKFLNPRPHDDEAEVLTTQSPSSVK
jgi:hypothetical protein